MRFEALPNVAGSLLILWSFLLFPWITILMIAAGRIRMPWRKSLILPAGGAVLVLYYIMLEIWNRTNGNYFVPDGLKIGLPVWLAVLLLVMLTVYLAFLQYAILRRKRASITPHSIKEAVDLLPIGLAFCEENGLVYLSNKRINSFAGGVGEHSVRNGNEFWMDVTGASAAKVLPDGSILVSLRDDSTWAVKRKRIGSDADNIYELSANDFTQEYTLNLELEQKEARTAEMNRRLKALRSRITTLTIEKEILDSKIRVHDRWAEGLMRARQYLGAQGSVTKEEVLSAWEKNISQLAASEDTSVSFGSQYREILESARVLGIRIIMNGKLYEESQDTPIILQALTSCLSNVACHTDGKTMYVDFREAADSFLMVIQDDGSAPVEEVRESGGLRNLRRSVEGAGGSMTVAAAPQFTLRIRFPRVDVSKDGGDGYAL